MSFYTTDVVEDEYHSGYAETTAPFSRVEWYLNGNLTSTDTAPLGAPY
ncbi:MAG: hypothetical protein OXT69_13705 [Candidatus Poribacteria bacterium]|nr:hypothetical protein [Candidatus Poribacteria bacterium]